MIAAVCAQAPTSDNWLCGCMPMYVAVGWMGFADLRLKAAHAPSCYLSGNDSPDEGETVLLTWRLEDMTVRSGGAS